MVAFIFVALQQLCDVVRHILTLIFYRWRNSGSERLNGFFKIRQNLGLESGSNYLIFWLLVLFLRSWRNWRLDIFTSKIANFIYILKTTTLPVKWKKNLICYETSYWGNKQTNKHNSSTFSYEVSGLWYRNICYYWDPREMRGTVCCSLMIQKISSPSFSSHLK